MGGGKLAEAIKASFGSEQALKEALSQAAAGNFASGWTWLVIDKAGDLAVMNTDDADTPVATGTTALLTCDVWEHAYYIDYRNARGSYVDAWWNLVDWDVVEQRFSAA